MSIIYCFCKYSISYVLSSANVNLAIFNMQLDVTSSQLLVTDSDFRDEAFRKQLSETVKSLLKLRVVPIFNENDAVSTRKAPYEVCNSACSYTFSFEICVDMRFVWGSTKQISSTA